MAHCYLHVDLTLGDVGQRVELSETESRHAAVARLRVGERVMLTSGSGTLAEARVLESGKRSTTLLVLSAREVPRPESKFTLVQALAKGERSEIAVAAATELGVDAIVPWQAERSIVQWRGERADKGVQKWQSAATEASKQAIRPWIPHVAPLAVTSDLRGLGAALVVLDPESELSLVDALEQGSTAFVVGPEGGISPTELQELEDAGAKRVRLGQEVLRTSTAGLAAIAAASPVLGRW
ncbi:MAG TPA: 16S rRNA (uracil(1498)-N(3))-methyltransferase [Candidatus Agrococcus pullicola]|uniref:Ribosomal RNA small subunit methyltransferase E n=1 Tax=Candidatus Agrococcus pullicola TaxID=2838429 RepID=A0A9D1YV02_9MICO|nr:16S rRNA (uracil(1498)-N(3))-methyltransferase [Candidatus Agrococcus pullicola]